MGKRQATSGSIVVGEAGIRIKDLEVPRRAVADYLRERAADEREGALIEALEVGVFCLERASGARDLDFVRREVDKLLLQVTEAVSTIPEVIQARLLEKLGTNDGEVLAPVQRTIDGVSKSLGERVREVRDLLAEKIDPDRRSSVLGRALGSIGDLLDPARHDSIQSVLARAVEDVSRRDGALARCVKATVAEAVKPLADEVERLAKQLAADEAAREAVAGTTVKGATFEEQVVVELQRWAAGTGATVSHVGADNRPGDVVIAFPSSGLVQPPMTIVVEVRDRAQRAGRKVVADAMQRAMAERSADAGIYLSRSGEGLARELGDWAEGACDRGDWVATTLENLVIAIRFLVIQARLAAARRQEAVLNRAKVLTQLGRIRTSLKRITTINRAVADIRAGAGTVQEEAEALRREIRDALAEAEEAIRSVSAEAAVA